ncbi:MAG: ribosome biogenesis/translation initiation ATPase RLI [Candidatus Bilamarchaeaceae archaeon]
MGVRIAVVDRELCTKEECGYRCMKVCPVNRMGQECIIKEESTGFPLISEALCIGCGICVKKCPLQCISIINLARESGTPIFQYGPNSFRLYGLPLPRKEGGAISLVGKNGIGKTTAIKILSGQLKPNLGIIDGVDENTVFQKLPIDMQRYFQSIGKDLKMVVKPQYIDKIRLVFDGTVRELFEKEMLNVEEIARDYGFFEILDRKIKALSGGELQKVAIAFAASKNADVYYFDEITNYLDIEERMNVGLKIKELSEKKSVLMAEHDLTILDYVSDYVYLIYGSENVYGIVSQLKNVRSGINEYLAGHLKEENVRFREYEITFATHSEGELKTPLLFRYSPLKKSYEDFTFSSEAGDIRKGEIIGLVGKNALGKSLFVKMLAGVEKPSEGESLGIRVSYKPQYISAEEKKVSEIFGERSLDASILEECKRKLNLNSLMEKYATELSGGELQRVALALALSTEADAYLFDEPSAFLDIEQRFIFASLLRRVITEKEKCAFVVDHDIVFIDAISNRLIVFDGKSSVRGHASQPYSKRIGMNIFLSSIGITMRRDKDSNRPRINKPGSVLDREQKDKNEYYYIS